MMDTLRKFKTLTSCFNNFHPIFISSHLQVHFFPEIFFSLYILWIKMGEFSYWQCLVSCLISSQGRTNKHNLCLNFNKIDLKNKQAKNIFYLKRKLNQVSVKVLPVCNCYARYQKMQFCIQLYVDIWKIVPYLQANPYRLKTKNINSLISVSTIIN